MKRIKQYLVLCVLLTLALPMVAAPVRFTTDRTIGSSFNIAVNSGLQVTINWENGESESFLSDGSLTTIPVKASSAEINTNYEILSLYLGNNAITALEFDITASSIRQLYCPENLLTQLDLTVCHQLVDLNCQDNQLSQIQLSSCLLETCDLSNNQLKNITIPGNGNYLRTLSLSGNQITELTGVEEMKHLESLFMANNQIRDLSLRKNKQLRQVVAYNNVLTNLQTSGLKQLQQVWVSNNQLQKLNLDAASQLVSIKADHNQLSHILWTADCQQSFNFMDVTDNRLFFNSLPTIYDQEKKTYSVEAHVLPQSPYVLTESLIETKNYAQWKDEFTQNGWKILTALKTQFESNGTAVPADLYTLQNGVLTFHKALPSVTIAAESADYPGIRLTTAPFEVKELTLAEVTFNYQYKGRTIATESKQYEMGTKIEELPQKHEKDFCTYEFDKITVEHPQENVNVNVIWNGPFDFSDAFETATWYYLTINSGDKLVGYLHHRDQQPIELTATLGSEDYYWAFLGDPFHIQVVNLSQGKDKSLCNTPDFPLVQGKMCPWSIFAANATKGKFLLHDDERGYTFYTNKVIKYSPQSTQGAHFIVQKAPKIEKDYTQKVIQEIAPFFDENHLGHYFELTREAYDAYKDKVKAAESECNATTYQELKTMLNKHILYPADGFYRLKNAASQGYLYAQNKGALFCDGKAKQLETVVEIRSVLPPGNVYKEEHPFLLIQDKWCSNTNVNHTPTLLDSKANFIQYLPLAPGKFAFAIAYYNARPGWEEHLQTSFYTASTNQQVKGSDSMPTLQTTASVWTIEAATQASVELQSIGDTYYGTLYVTYPVSVENGTANRLYVENGKGHLEAIDGTVPGKTPVVLCCDQTPANIRLQPGTSTPLEAQNILQGCLLPIDNPTGDLFLGAREGIAGFYPIQQPQTAANSAFVPETSAPAGGFEFYQLKTGIESLILDKDTKVYDLQGRRVMHPQSGVYIVNQRKVYIK